MKIFHFLLRIAVFLGKLCFFTSSCPQNQLYLTSKSSRAKEDGCADLPKVKQGCSVFIPCLGIKCSHTGNEVFPRWEYS